MSSTASGLPVVVRYDEAGKPTGFKEATTLNVSALNVSSVSATVVYGDVYTGPDGDPTFTIANLSSIQDVEIGEGISADQVLRWDPISLKWYPSDAVETVPIDLVNSFTGLDDTPAYYDNGQLIKSTTNSITFSTYNESDIAYISSTVDTLQLSDLDDTLIDTPTQSEFLQYIDGYWQNAQVSLSNIATKIQVEVRNETGSPILEGTVVYVNGVHGTSAKKLTIATASVDITNLEDKLLGVLPVTLNNNDEGVMTILGVVSDFDTDLSGIQPLKEGFPVYLDPYTPGSLTTIVPTPPTPILEVGVLNRKNSSNGEIFVRFLRGGRLETLYNVYIPSKEVGDAVIWTGNTYGVSAHAVSGLRDTLISSPTNNQALIWNGTRWINKAPTISTLGDVSIVTPSNGDVINYDATTSSWKNITPVTTVPLEGDQGKVVLIASAGTQYYNSNNIIWDYATNTLDITGAVYATEFYGNGTGLSGITADWDGSHIGDATINGSLTVTGTSTVVGNMSGTGDIDINGTLTAAAKSFLITHPTKEGMKLQYTCLEGPENGVYCRGRVKTNIIILPDYWVGLVDEDTITVNLTPAGKRQPNLFVEDIRDNKIFLSSSESIDCFYTIFGERKDIDKLIVEF